MVSEEDKCPEAAADEPEAAMADPAERADEPIRETRSRRSEKRQRTAMISIRLTAQELDTVQTQARARGLSVSRYVRERALQPARPESATSAYGFTVTNRTYRDMEAVRVEMSERIATPAAPYIVRSDTDLVALNAS